jgi:hypothetical protein
VELTRSRLALLVAGLIALLAAAVAAAVLLTGGDSSPEAQTGASPPPPPGPAQPPADATPAATGVAALVPGTLFRDCRVDATAVGTAAQSASCSPPSSPTARTLPFYPDSWRVSIYSSAAELNAAYDQLRRAHDIGRDFGRCDNVGWGGEAEWFHGPQKPGGRRFCYFEGNVAVIVWTHGKLGQGSHVDTLGEARAGGSDHAGLFNWYRFWHHRIGKCPQTDCVARLQ